MTARTLGPLLAALWVLPASAQDAPDSGWVVLFRDGAGEPRETAEALGRSAGGRVVRVFRHAVRGCALGGLSRAAAESLARDPRVASVERDQPVHAAQSQAFPPWGLDRIDQRDLPLDDLYAYGTTGAGVTVYVIDSGIRISHADFGGRASYGWDFVDGDATAQDGFGHGTHVAGIVGGATYGAAKAAQLVAVRVLDNAGAGLLSDLIAAVDWVTANAVRPAVANISITAPASSTLDLAVRGAAFSGIAACAASGSAGGAACDFSPGREVSAITVGATDPTTDFEAAFSNAGACVDLLGPGVSILSAWHTSDTAALAQDGTSAAAAHASGAAALFLEAYPQAMPWDVEASLVANATSGRLQGMKSPQTPNLLLYTLGPAFVAGTPPPPIPRPSRAGYTACGLLGAEFISLLLAAVLLGRRRP